MKRFWLTLLTLALLPMVAHGGGTWSYDANMQDSRELVGGTWSYRADMQDSRWLVGGDRMECRLSQSVPGFGRAIFRAGAGNRFRLDFEAERERATQPFSVRLTAEPPSWRSERTRPVARKLVQPRREQTVISFEGQPALRALYELERGMNPNLAFHDWADGSERINVALSAMNVRGAIEDFQTCMASLHPDSFDDVARFHVAFEPAVHELDRGERAKLDRMLAYAKVDPTVEFAILAGHTDNQGPEDYNEELAQLRVDAVRQYLEDGSFPADRIVELVWGPEQPVADNTTPEGRAQNRRVEVELRRTNGIPDGHRPTAFR